MGPARTRLSQGLACFHAGVELLRSKGGDRNSCDSGNGFNCLGWSLQSQHWGAGLPPKTDNLALWPARIGCNNACVF